MNWIPLSDQHQLEELNKNSLHTPQIIFKHSTRCSISSVIKNRMERSKAPEGIPFHIVDLIKFRPISNQIAQDYHIEHQSPQILVIVNGKCIYDESHSGIDMQDIIEHAKAA